MMNYRKVLMIVMLLTAISGCKKLDKLTQFRMEFDETIVIPATSVIDLPFDIITPEIETDSETKLNVNDTRKDLVEQIKLESLVMSITIPSDSDFSFLNSVNVYLSAEGLPEIRIAWKESVPASIGDELELEVTDANLREYLMKDAIKMRLNTLTDEIISSDHHIEIHSVFWVDAKILGI